ncbi:MAG: hypothetical protein AAFW70_21305 [Cyanobacteria bacterium J06635_10]
MNASGGSVYLETSLCQVIKVLNCTGKKDTLFFLFRKKYTGFESEGFLAFIYPLVLRGLIMNWNQVSTGILVMASLVTTALPVSASPYRTYNNDYRRNEVVKVVDINVNLRGQNRRRVNKKKFKEVCTKKRIRVRGRVRTIKECKLVRVRR